MTRRNEPGWPHSPIPCPGPAPINRGSIVQIPAPPNGAESLVIPAAQWQSDDLGVGASVNCWINEYVPAGPNGGLDECPVLARLQWGVGGARQQADVDVAVGTWVRLPGAEDVAVSFLAQAAGTSFVTLSCGVAITKITSALSIGYGTNTRSYPVQNLANGGATDVWPVPPYAFGFKLYLQLDGNYNVNTLLEFYADDAGLGRLIQRRDLATAAPGIGQQGLASPGYLLPPACKSVSVINNGAAAWDYVPVFYLRL